MNWLTQPATTQQMVFACVAAYMIAGFMGSWVMIKIFQRADEGNDPIERAQINGIVHKTGVGRPVFIIAGGVFWPVLFFIGLTNILTGR